MSDNAESVATITSVSEQVGTGRQNTPVNGYRVYFTSAAGNKGSVFLDKQTYSPDAAKEAVRAEAMQLDEITNVSV